MRIVSSYGGLYRRQLRLIAAGEGYRLPEAKCIGQLDTDLTSLDADEAGSRR